MTKVIIVGAGAAGLTAAICAKRRHLEVMVLERNKTSGKKLVMTGNGHCNYWNEDQDISHYHSSSSSNLQDYISSENQAKVMKFFTSLGLIPKIKNGYYYPYSMQAVSMKAILMNEIKALDIPIMTDSLVTKIEKRNSQFLVYTENNVYQSEYVIMATGSKATFHTGSDGNGYTLLASLGHTIIPVLPSLTQVFGVSNYYKEWNGIRVDAALTLVEDGKLVRKEQGEVQLTDYGLSGICVFNLSGQIAKGLAHNKNYEIILNFMADLHIQNETDLLNWLQERNAKLLNRHIDQLFDGILPYKLVYLFLHLANISNSLSFSELTNKQKDSLAKLIVSHRVPVAKTNDFTSAQVCSGGVSLQEINPKTMESLKVKGLYVVGELLDVDGDCGGYNLGFAWISGILAGEALEND